MQKYLRRLTSLTLALLMVFSLVSYQEVGAVTANAGEHFYVEGDDTGWSYSGNTITISKDGDYTISKACNCTDGLDHSDYSIVIGANLTINITIEDIKIAKWSGAAMNIDGTSTVTLILEGDNSFVSGALYAGIQFNNATGSLEIISYTNGTLAAQGGDYGAGIGGGDGASASNITISGGTVTATGGVLAAGIGGGWQGSASNITITGGNVTANAVYMNDSYTAAGIGGGIFGSASNITISGGSVTASGYNGIGGGANGSTSNINITGGSVKVNRFYYTTPQNGSDENVYLVEIPDMSGINSVTVDNDTYIRSGNHDTDGTFYLYLTGQDHEIIANSTNYRAVWNASSSSFTLMQCVETPNASFIATGEDSGTLSNVDTSMMYSVDGGTTWNGVTDVTIEISGVTPEYGIQVYKMGDGTTTADSFTQTITVTKASTPTVSSTNCTTTANNDGQITGVNSTMEYRLSTASEWTAITSDTLTDLSSGTYYVRVKASGAQLASDYAIVNISQYSEIVIVETSTK